LITSADDQSGAEGVAVISARYWQRRFGNDTAVLGKAIDLNGVPCSIIGIIPPDFFGVDEAVAPDVFAAIELQPRFEPAKAESLTSFGLWPFTLVARLKPDHSPQQVAAEFTVVFQQILAERGRESLREADIKDIPNRKIVLMPGAKGLSKLSQRLSKPLFILMGVTGSILLIACVNVANLLLSRGASRRKEIALRLATGATRTRLVGQLLVESGLLAAIGAVLGVMFASWSKTSLLRFLPSDTAAFTNRLELDYRMIGFTAAISLVAAILFGVLPAFRMIRIDLVTSLRESAQNLSSTGSRLRLSNILLIAQVAVSLLVLVGAGLFIRTMWELRHVNLGFNANNVALLTIKPAVSGYNEKELGTLVDKLVDPELIARLERLPSIQSASLSSSKPIADLPWWSASLKPLNGSFDDNPTEKVYLNGVTPGYFSTLGIPLRQGGTSPRPTAGGPRWSPSLMRL
jgi:predicted permease